MYGVFTYDCGALPKHYASYRDLGDANREVDYLTNHGVKAWVFEIRISGPSISYSAV
jgi:hypothetical protein